MLTVPKNAVEYPSRIPMDQKRAYWKKLVGKDTIKMTTTIVFHVLQNVKTVIMPGSVLLTNVILLVVLVQIHSLPVALHVLLGITK